MEKTARKTVKWTVRLRQQRFFAENEEPQPLLDVEGAAVVVVVVVVVAVASAVGGSVMPALTAVVVLLLVVDAVDAAAVVAAGFSSDEGILENRDDGSTCIFYSVMGTLIIYFGALIFFFSKFNLYLKEQFLMR